MSVRITPSGARWYLKSREWRVRFALSMLVALSGASCASWHDETQGTAPLGETTTTGGGGGSGACISCKEFVQASSSCQAPDCPTADEVCPGASRDALDAFFDCAFCDACVADCADMCGAGGAGMSGLSGQCQGCLIGALGGVCATQYAACTER